MGGGEVGKNAKMTLDTGGKSVLQERRLHLELYVKLSPGHKDDVTF